jgi:hypothetical protein
MDLSRPPDPNKRLCPLWQVQTSNSGFFGGCISTLVSTIKQPSAPHRKFFLEKKGPILPYVRGKIF